MSKKISELAPVSIVTGKEVIPVLIDKDNKTIKVDDIKQYISDSTKSYVSLLEKGTDTIYRLYIKNGEVCITKESAYSGESPEEGNNILYDGLIINQMYGAGDSSITPVSHSFIELYNFRDEEINLKGLYLFYRTKDSAWMPLELIGTIPSRHSFLIRCKQQTDPYSDSVTVPILDYDMEWDIALSNSGFSVYLCIGSDIPEDNPIRQTKDTDGNITYTNGRYIDLLGAGGKQDSETIIAYETRYLHCMDKNTGIRRRDFANGGTKNIGSNALVKGNNEADCEPVDYNNCDPSIYRPRSLKDGRWNEFYDKPVQSKSSPSMINISFDKDGTGRCFCFHTPVTDEGYVYYKKQTDSLWKVQETTVSVVKDMDGLTSVHKCKIPNLEVGIYEYKVGYDGCWSDVATFEVKDYSQSDQNINILWTSDQQGYDKREYNVWRQVARYLRQNNGYLQYDFHLNTGDISQIPKRRYQWDYYYNYAGEFTKNMPHMISVGNNDLANKRYSDIFENYIYEDDKFANSVYAFDLGFTHFICLNSNEDYTYVDGSVGGYTSTDEFLEAQMTWFDEHMNTINARATKPRWVIIYAHLSPFTVGRTKRLQRWISHFERYKIDLVLCGHNHAYSRSKALKTGYDYNSSPAYNDYVTTISSESTELKIVDEYQADGSTLINRDENIAEGVTYILNHACGFKLSGKEGPLDLSGKNLDAIHLNSEGGPWWITKQGLPENPCYCTLDIQYDKIDFKCYEVKGIVSYDDHKNTIINEDLSKVSTEIYDSLTINYSDRTK